MSGGSIAQNEQKAWYELYDKQKLELIVRAGLLSIHPDLSRTIMTLAHTRIDEIEGAYAGTRFVTDRGLPFIEIAYDPHFLSRFLPYVEEAGDHVDVLISRISATPQMAVVTEHELWHILRGDVFDRGLLERYVNDPLFMAAVECAINEGHIGIERIRQADLHTSIINFDSFGVRSEVMQYASAQNWDAEWIRDHNRIYEALKQFITQVSVSPCGNGKVKITLQKGDQTTEIEVDLDKLSQEQSEAASRHDQDALDKANELRRNVIIQIQNELERSGKFDIDPYTDQVRYSPHGFSEEERHLHKHRAIVLDWGKIYNLLGLERGWGYNRRIGHMTPILVRSKLTPRRIAAFVDSSGSVPDDLLSRFIATCKQSPYNVDIKYFSTQISDKPHTGGTSFQCIEEYLRTLPRYPDLVLVLTDGEDFGPDFTILHPKRWYWVVYDDRAGDMNSRLARVRRLGGTIINARMNVA